MKYVLCFLAINFLFANCFSQSNLALSPNQKKLTAFIKKYNDAMNVTSDSIAKLEVFYKMYIKQVPFIEDSLKSNLDGFVFKTSAIKIYIDKKNGQEYLYIYLDNGNFIAENYITSKKRADLESLPIFKMARNIKTSIPVKAFGMLTGLSFGVKNFNHGIDRIHLTVNINALYN